MAVELFEDNYAKHRHRCSGRKCSILLLVVISVVHVTHTVYLRSGRLMIYQINHFLIFNEMVVTSDKKWYSENCQKWNLY